jgi:LytR cell envelope-related transcriptional attenuator
VVAVVIALASPDAHRATSPRPHTTTTAPAPAPARPHVTVSVLNGTTVTGLARVAAETLVANGFREGVVTNDTTNQQRARSEIFYEPGHRTEGYAVADCLDIPFDRVLPMDATARVAADRAEVAVFIGADKAK